MSLGSGPKCGPKERQNRLCLSPPQVLLMGQHPARGQALHAGLGDTPHGPRGWPPAIPRLRGAETRQSWAPARPGCPEETGLDRGWDVGSVPTRLPGQSPNAICSAGPWKNILLGRLRAGPEGTRPLARSGAGTGPPEQTRRGPQRPEPGPGPAPAQAHLASPPQPAAGDTALRKRRPSAPCARSPSRGPPRPCRGQISCFVLTAQLR